MCAMYYLCSAAGQGSCKVNTWLTAIGMTATRGKKRVAELESTIPASKRKISLKMKNVLEKVLSLCADKNSLTAGMVVVRSPSCCYEMSLYL